MRRYIFIVLIICLLSSLVNPAEILLCARKHWVEKDGADTTGLTIEQHAEYAKMVHYGSAVVVKEDDASWGTKETLPNFILVKIPGLDPDTLIKFIRERLYDADTVVKIKRFYIPFKVMDSLVILAQPDGIITTNKNKAKAVFKEYILP